MKKWKGILLAGGTASRLFPASLTTNKHLFPVYNKPMIYYPLSTLMLAGIRDIVVITTEAAAPLFRLLLRNGSQWGLRLEYRIQERAGGIAEALLVAADQIEGANVALVLGDNIIHGSGLSALLRKAMSNDGATVFAYPVSNPRAFGIVTLDANEHAVAIAEKPKEPRSNLAVIGLYFYDSKALEITRGLKPSARGELEITDVNREYMEQGRLHVQPLGRGFAWLDGGTPEDLFEASDFVKTVEMRTGLSIACLEEIALRNGFVQPTQMRHTIAAWPQSGYRAYVEQVLAELGREARPETV